MSRETRARKGQGWRYDAGTERLMKLRDERPADYDRLNPNLKMRVGYYEADKQLAAAAGIDTDPPSGD